MSSLCTNGSGRHRPAGRRTTQRRALRQAPSRSLRPTGRRRHAHPDQLNRSISRHTRKPTPARTFESDPTPAPTTPILVARSGVSWRTPVRDRRSVSYAELRARSRHLARLALSDKASVRFPCGTACDAHNYELALSVALYAERFAIIRAVRRAQVHVVSLDCACRSYRDRRRLSARVVLVGGNVWRRRSGTANSVRDLIAIGRSRRDTHFKNRDANRRYNSSETRSINARPDSVADCPRGSGCCRLSLRSGLDHRSGCGRSRRHSATDPSQSPSRTSLSFAVEFQREPDYADGVP
jgi:hypothetical protein